MANWEIAQVVHSTGEEDSLEFARIFAATLRPGHRVALAGDLGAGKTVLCRGICQALGFTGPVHSPTYGIVHEYPNTPPIFHLDLYRLQNAGELQELGLEEHLLVKSICLVEWPEKLDNDVFFSHRLRIYHTGDSLRKITVEHR